MQYLELARVVVPENRQRKEFEPESLSDLCDDIAARGLLHPIVVREGPDNTWYLVAGERRLRAITDLHDIGISFTCNNRVVDAGVVPATTLGELSDRDAELAELSENIYRKDLTWQERAEAEARLHGIRSEEAAERGEVQTLVATAAEILGDAIKENRSTQVAATAKLKENLTVAQHLADPDVAKAKSLKEAVKIVEKKKTEAHYAAKALELGKTQVSSRHTLIQGDCLVELQQLQAETFDVILTDPPYGIDAQNFGTQIARTHNFDDSQKTWETLMAGFARESFRVAKPLAHAYVFCDPRRFSRLAGWMFEAGWYVWEVPLVWVKPQGIVPRPEHAPRRVWEAVLYCIKGDRPVTAIYTDVIQGIKMDAVATPHPDQKPVDLYQNLLRRSVRPGDFVLDPFAGSGTIFPAANRMNLTAVGIEQHPVNFAVATARLSEQ